MQMDTAAAEIIKDNSEELNPTTDFGRLFDLIEDEEIAIAVEDWLDACESRQCERQHITPAL